MLNLVESTQHNHADALPSTPAEAGRLAALKRYDILDTPQEAAFDHITALAADLFKAPISIISFLDGGRLWFKSHHGLDATEIKWGRDATSSAVELRLRREFNPGFFACAPLRTPDGHDLGTLCVIDHHSRQIEPAEIRHLEALAKIVIDLLELRLAKKNASARAGLMAAEIDHRAMNSLQFVASLLHLQSRAVGAEAGRQLATAANRVLAVARVHRNFAAEATADRIPVLAYLRRLCGELSDILAAPVAVEGSEASIPTRHILAIGLVVNELVTNAKKHGDGAIKVTFCAREDGQYELCVLDRGAGLPEGFSLGATRADALGMKVVAALTSQLDGKLSAGPNPAGPGACFTLVFPAA
jgi:two-component sensor histidine kinase